MLNEMSEKDKHTVYQLCVKSKKKKNTSTSEYNKRKKETHKYGDEASNYQ